VVPCVIMGDSIAVGVGMYRPDCETVARSGISSARYVSTMLSPQDAQTIVISLGVNDDDTIDTVTNLRQMRSELRAETVYWLLPGIRERKREAIREVAQEYGDRLIETRGYTGRDHLHPTGAGYQVLASLTEGEAPSFTSRYAAIEPGAPEVYTPTRRLPVVIPWPTAARHRYPGAYAHWNHRNSFRVALGSRWIARTRIFDHGFGTVDVHRASYRLAVSFPHPHARRFASLYVPAGRSVHMRHGRFAATKAHTATYRMYASFPQVSGVRYTAMALPPRARSHSHVVSSHTNRPPRYMRMVACFRRAANACVAVFRPERG
jgi:hypothetical protein